MTVSGKHTVDLQFIGEHHHPVAILGYPIDEVHVGKDHLALRSADFGQFPQLEDVACQIEARQNAALGGQLRVFNAF